MNETLKWFKDLLSGSENEFQQLRDDLKSMKALLREAGGRPNRFLYVSENKATNNITCGCGYYFVYHILVVPNISDSTSSVHQKRQSRGIRR